MNKFKLIVSVVVGIVLGFIFAKLVFIQYLTLIPWGIAGLIIGYRCKSKAESLKNGLVYGFWLGFVFIAAGYQGAAPFLSRIPFFVIIGLFCSVFGAGLGFAGFFIKNRIKK